jgi:hypothetical protein
MEFGNGGRIGNHEHCEEQHFDSHGTIRCPVCFAFEDFTLGNEGERQWAIQAVKKYALPNSIDRGAPVISGWGSSHWD